MCPASQSLLAYCSRPISSGSFLCISSDNRMLLFLAFYCRISNLASYFCIFFFFSSRRRHTRCLSDWSSDVCSSDLDSLVHLVEDQRGHLVPLGHQRLDREHDPRELASRGDSPERTRGFTGIRLEQIGRASCRERV